MTSKTFGEKPWQLWQASPDLPKMILYQKCVLDLMAIVRDFAHLCYSQRPHKSRHVLQIVLPNKKWLYVFMDFAHLKKRGAAHLN